MVAFETDSDMAPVLKSQIPKIITTLFLATGSDYTSFFGKATVLNTFFMHSDFIVGENMDGSLANYTTENRDSGFLSFLRLVGTLYFKRHLSSFISLMQIQTPNQLYHSIDPSLSTEKRHEKFIEIIYSINRERLLSEDERMPSVTALYRHWLRTSYISCLWNNADNHDVYVSLPIPEESGWLLNPDGEYTIDWEDKNMMAEIGLTID